MASIQADIAMIACRLPDDWSFRCVYNSRTVEFSLIDQCGVTAFSTYYIGAAELIVAAESALDIAIRLTEGIIQKESK